jgi:hypothetical protein
MGFGQTTEGLAAAISTPSYFLFDAALGSNGTTLADTSDVEATDSNQSTTILLLLLLHYVAINLQEQVDPAVLIQLQASS